MNLFASQLVIMDPGRVPGGREMGVVNDVRTGRWELYPRRKDAHLVSVTLLHETAAACIAGRQTDLSDLEGFFRSTFVTESFEVTCEKAIAFLDLAAYLATPGIVGVEQTLDFIREGKDRSTLKGHVHRDLRRTFEAGHLLKHHGEHPLSGRPSVLRDEEGCAVAIFLYLR